MGSIKACVHTTHVLHIPYRPSRATNHFFCDVPAMLTLAFTDTWVYEHTVSLSTTLWIVFPLIGLHVPMAVPSWLPTACPHPKGGGRLIPPAAPTSPW